MANAQTDIIAIVAKQAKIEPAMLTSETHLTDINLQSIDIVELIFAIEDKFDISVPYSPTDLTSAGISFETVGDLIQAVVHLTAEQHPQ
jgi:acyl carrier protein